MNDVASAAGIDIHRDFKWLAIASFVLYYVIGTAICACKGEKCDVQAVRFYVFHAVFVPIVAFVVFWNYAHPEQVEVPDGWMSDLRSIWPIFAVIDMCYVAVFLNGSEARRKAYYLKQALRYRDIGNELYLEGNQAEAEYAWAKAKWILDHKWKGR